MTRNRVVITGVGCVTPLGSDVHQVWNRLTEGRSGVGRLTIFDASRFPVQIAAEVKDWSIAEVGEDPARWRHHPRQTLFAVASGIKAMQSAGFEGRYRGAVRSAAVRRLSGLRRDLPGLEPVRRHDGPFDGGRSVSSRKIHRASAAIVASDEELELELNMPAAHLAAHFNAQGPNANCIAACASSSQAIGEAAEMIRAGEVDLMMAGGATA